MSNPSQPSQWAHYPGIPIILDTQDECRNAKSIKTDQRGSQMYLCTSRRQSVRYITVASPIQTGSHYLEQPTPQLRRYQPRRSILQVSSTIGSRRDRKSRIQDPTIEQNADGTWTTKYNEKRSLPWSSAYREKVDPELGNKPVLGLGMANESLDAASIIDASSSTDKGECSTNNFERWQDKFWRYTSGVTGRWSLEVISWGISAVCMSAVILILAYLKDKPLPDWPAGLLLTFLFKIASAALLVPTSEALGQLKWIWFKGESNKTWDFEIFDLASRGPWGSLLLLLRTKGRALASLGAAVTLLSMALDPVFQQVVDFPERWTFESNSSIPMNKHYDPGLGTTYQGGARLAQQDLDLQSITNKFFFNNGTQPIPFGNGTRADIPLSCPTSKCTWTPYQTLGFCSSCVDVSELLTFACLETRVDWTSNLTGTGNETYYPNSTMCGYFVNITSVMPILMSGYLVNTNDSSQGEALLTRALPLVTVPYRLPLWGGSINFKNIRNPTVDFLLVSAANGSAGVYRNETPVAQECVFSWCVKTMQSSFQNANYEERVVDTFINTTRGSFPWSSYRVTGPINGTSIQYSDNVTVDASSIGHNTSDYGVSNTTAIQITALFDDILPSFTTVQNSSASVKEWLRHSIRVTGAPRTQNLAFNPWQYPNNVTRHMERLATAMTNDIRSGSSTVDHIGMAFGKESYVAVHWPWLSLPVSLLALSGVFLVGTMIKTSKELGQVGVWKTSATATLLYSCPGEIKAT